jgi:hypothetical protein
MEDVNKRYVPSTVATKEYVEDVADAPTASLQQ